MSVGLHQCINLNSPKIMPPIPPLHPAILIQPCAYSPVDLSSVERQTSSPVYIDFNDLCLFEQVEQQYLQQGIELEGAIAIQPSNPAFQTDRLAIMPNADRTDIVIRFRVPRRQVQAIVTGARAIKLTAFDTNQQIAQQSVGVAQYLQLPQLPSSDSSRRLPQHQIELAGENQPIHQIQISSDAPFVLHHLVVM